MTKPFCDYLNWMLPNCSFLNNGVILGLLGWKRRTPWFPLHFFDAFLSSTIWSCSLYLWTSSNPYSTFVTHCDKIVVFSHNKIPIFTDTSYFKTFVQKFFWVFWGPCDDNTIDTFSIKHSVWKSHKNQNWKTLLRHFECFSNNVN